MRLWPFAGRWLLVHGKVQVSLGIWILLPAALLLLPLRWVLSWVLAVIIHETGHYLALRLYKVPIYSLRLSPIGVIMQTGDLRGKETVFCALAGPLFALLFTVFSPIFPCTAVCILFQSIFNLLPVYPLDGGRALRAFLYKLLPNSTANWIEMGILSLSVAGCLQLFYFLRLGFLPSFVLLLIFAQKFLANWGNSRYNRGK